MPLSVLVVGRGSRAPAIVQQGHTLCFVEAHANEGGDVSPISEYDFVLVHLSNDEAPAAVALWESAGQASKIVGLSGGGQVPDLFLNWQYPFLPGVETRAAVLRLDWAAVPDDFNGTSSELVALLRSRTLHVLSALAILCQGYLAVVAKEGNASNNSYVCEALKEMGWDSDQHLPLVTAGVEAVSGIDWWLQAFGLAVERNAGGDADEVRDQWTQFNSSVRGEWGKQDLPAEVARFVTTLGQHQSPDAELVAQVYLALAHRLGAHA
jgi:hypothetical protein